MSPSDLVQKAVFGRSGNECAHPDCAEQLVKRDGGRTIIVGQLAHIVAKSVQGPRGHLQRDPTDTESPDNYIGLCSIHHKLVDSHPLKYSVPLLRAMKEIHESKHAAPNDSAFPLSCVRETVHSSMLWVRGLPSQVFAVPTKLGFEEVLKNLQGTELTPFVFRDGCLWTFHDLADSDGPFSKVAAGASPVAHPASDMWSNDDDHRLYINLLNRSIKLHLGKRGVRFDELHRRYYFGAKEPGTPVRRSYLTKTGKRAHRDVVRQGKFKDGTPKDVWWHLAVRMRFEQVADRSWYLTLRPEFHLTSDGQTPLESQRIGRRITRAKSTIYNEEYLNLIHFWRGVLSDETPRTVIQVGQNIIIDSHLADVSVDWPGIPSDSIPFSPDPYKEDLFTLAQLRDIDESDYDPFGSEWDEGAEGLT